MSAMPHQRGSTLVLMVTIPKPTMPTDAANTPPMSNGMSTGAVAGNNSPARPPTAAIATPVKAATAVSTPHLP